MILGAYKPDLLFSLCKHGKGIINLKMQNLIFSYFFPSNILTTLPIANQNCGERSLS